MIPKNGLNAGYLILQMTQICVCWQMNDGHQKGQLFNGGHKVHINARGILIVISRWIAAVSLNWTGWKGTKTQGGSGLI